MFWSRLFKLFEIFVVFLYFVIGFFLLFFAQNYNLPKNIKIIFGFFFISYGAFRTVRIWNKYKNMKI